MLRDMRFAIRMLLKQPGFSMIAVLTLALGIGATSAVFSLIQGVLLTPPPYKKPQQLVLVPTTRTDGQTQENPRGWAAQQWMDWQKEAKSFEGIAAYGWTFNFLIRNDGSQSIEGMVVTKDYLQIVGLQPRELVITIPRLFARGGSLHVHDPHNSRIDILQGHRATRLERHAIARIAKLL